MKTYSLSHLSDRVLLRDLAALVAQDRTTTAALLAHIAEVDARRLYLPAAYPSMYAYCVHELRLSEDAAFKRIQAARTARRFPAIFAALADGRLHLSAVTLLVPHLTEETAEELLTAAAHKSKSDIEQLLAERFPRPEVPARLEAIASPATLPDEQLAPGQVGTPAEQPAAWQADVPVPRPKVTPLSPERFALQLTIERSTHDKLRYAQALLSHQVPSGEVAEVLDRALDALIGQLEKRKFAAATRPRVGRRRSTGGGRHIPADVKRVVWERDQGRCTFVSEAGQRCPARTLLEFDHIDPVARGGQATVERMRLRCRAHNQYEAECTFGTEFMSGKRGARRAAAAVRTATKATAARAQAAARARAEAAAEAEQAGARRAEAAAEAERARERDVIPWLRQLGFRADEARRAAALCETIPDAPLEERVRVALSCFPGRAPSHGLRRAAKDLGTAA
ncbi:MAG: hypothetical protein AAB290_06725 [Candidatus Eisenbacteria bacterium]